MAFLKSLAYLVLYGSLITTPLIVVGILQELKKDKDEILLDRMLSSRATVAARDGHIEKVKLCKDWGATDFSNAMDEAALGGHIEIVKLCKEWGATDFNH